MKSFEYGYFEKFDTNLHGQVKNPVMSKYLSKDKYIYFETVSLILLLFIL